MNELAASENPIFLSHSEAYMDGNAEAFAEMQHYLMGAAIGAKSDAARDAVLRAAEYARSRQRDCNKSRWEARDERLVTESLTAVAREAD